MDIHIKKDCYKKQGLYLNYISLGQGQPVVFLHGGTFNTSTYKTILELLATKYLVIAPDLPCFGNSFVPKIPWDFTDYANFLDEFIKSLDLKNAVVIGHSFGGGVGWYLVNKNKQVSKLVLIDSAGVSLGESKIKLYLSAVNKTIIELIFYDKKITLSLIKDFFLGFIIRHFLKLPLVFKTINKSVYNSPTNGIVDKPTLILWGDRDEVLSANYAQKFKELASNSRLEFVHGNHDWCLFYPKVLFNKIVKFI